jgi:hypothetical protein
LLGGLSKLFVILPFSTNFRSQIEVDNCGITISMKKAHIETRGSHEPVIAHLVFYLTSKVIENGSVTNNFENSPSNDHISSNF